LCFQVCKQGKDHEVVMPREANKEDFR
jgi:hypothetical protein